MSETSVTLGELVKLAREKAGWDYWRMAEEMGWADTDPETAVKRIEKGKTRISILKLEHLLQAAGLSLDQCLRWPGDEKPEDPSVSLARQILARQDRESRIVRTVIDGTAKELGINVRAPSQQPGRVSKEGQPHRSAGSRRQKAG